MLYLNWGERRVRRLFYIAAWFFASRRDDGQGARGVRAPGGRGARVDRARRGGGASSCGLEIVDRGSSSGSRSSFPWYVAMYVRHGSPFTDRLIFHDMFNRAVHHVHDTNEGDDTSFRFYIWQLGYALFPWTGLAPLGLIYWLRAERLGREAGRRTLGPPLHVVPLRVRALLVHGDEVPPLHLPGGARGRDAHRRRARRHARRGGPVAATQGARLMYLGGAFAGLVVLLLGVARMLPGSLFGTKDSSDTGRIPLGIFLALVGGAIVAASAVIYGRKPATASAKDAAAPDARTRHERVMLAAAAVSGAFALLLVGADLDHQAGRRGPARRHPPPPALHVQLPARLARLARLLRGPGRLHRRRALRSSRSLVALRRHAVYVVLRVRRRVGRLGASTSTW